MKSRIEIVKSNIQKKYLFSGHSKLKFLKYEIRKFSISFSKNLAKTEWIIQTNLENIQALEQFLFFLSKKKILRLITCVNYILKISMITRPKLRKSVANMNGINMEKNRQVLFEFWKNKKAINTTVRHLIDDAKDITDLPLNQIRKVGSCQIAFK